MRKHPAGYTFRHYAIPERMAGGIMRWIQHGIMPGDFLAAVLRNDLRGACERADDENLANLPAFIGYFYNEGPASCWGSDEEVTAELDARENESDLALKEAGVL